MSRTAELVLGVLGGIFGILAGSFAVVVGGMGSIFGIMDAELVINLGFVAIFFRSYRNYRWCHSKQKQ